MNGVLAQPAAAAPGIERHAPRVVRLRRGTRLTISVGWQWLFSAAFISGRSLSQWEATLRRLCGGTLKALDIAVEIGGRVPSGPSLLVANHISWLDSFAINSVSPCRYLSKLEVRTMPVFGTIVKNGGRGIFIVRESAHDLVRAKDAIAAALREGYRIGLFAEATSSDGRRLGEFHSALFQAAIDACAIVQPVAISYHTADGLPTTSPAYWGDMTMKQSLAAIIRAPSIVARLEFCEPVAPGAIRRRELAAQARSRIAQKLGLASSPAQPISHQAMVERDADR
jgi:1-acyl-sn-glycerol-3-phosphate acyltransferase